MMWSGAFKVFSIILNIYTELMNVRTHRSGLEGYGSSYFFIVSLNVGIFLCLEPFFNHNYWFIRAFR